MTKPPSLAGQDRGVPAEVPTAGFLLVNGGQRCQAAGSLKAGAVLRQPSHKYLDLRFFAAPLSALPTAYRGTVAADTSIALRMCQAFPENISTYSLLQSSQQPKGVGLLVFSTLRMRPLKHREVE